MSLRRVGFCVLTVVLCLLVVGSPATTQEPSRDSGPPYLNPELPLDQRVDDLISRLTLEEKVSQMMNAAPAIPRVGIPQYDWWHEALHGVAFSGVATVFPQAIGLGATFDAPLVNRVGVIKVLQAIAEYEPEHIISTKKLSLASTYNYDPAPNCEIHGMDADLCENCGGCMECIGRDDAQFCVNCWYDDED